MAKFALLRREYLVSYAQCVLVPYSNASSHSMNELVCLLLFICTTITLFVVRTQPNCAIMLRVLHVLSSVYNMYLGKAGYLHTRIIIATAGTFCNE